jgi:hypothetical protein
MMNAGLQLPEAWTLRTTKPNPKAPPSILAAMTRKPGVQRNVVRHKSNGRSTGIRTTNAQIAERIMVTAPIRNLHFARPLVLSAARGSLRPQSAAGWQLDQQTSDNNPPYLTPLVHCLSPFISRDLPYDLIDYAPAR